MWARTRVGHQYVKEVARFATTLYVAVAYQATTTVDNFEC